MDFEKDMEGEELLNKNIERGENTEGITEEEALIIYRWIYCKKKKKKKKINETS